MLHLRDPADRFSDRLEVTPRQSRRLGLQFLQRLYDPCCHEPQCYQRQDKRRHKHQGRQLGQFEGGGDHHFPLFFGDQCPARQGNGTVRHHVLYFVCFYIKCAAFPAQRLGDSGMICRQFLRCVTHT